MMCDTPEVKEVIGRAATRILGRPLAVKVTEPGDEAPAGAIDKLDMLSKFDNVTIK